MKEAETEKWFKRPEEPGQGRPNADHCCFQRGVRSEITRRSHGRAGQDLSDFARRAFVSQVLHKVALARKANQFAGRILLRLIIHTL